MDKPEDNRAAAPVAWLGKVDQGMGHWHFEIAEPHAPNAFPVYRVNPVAAAQGPTREELAEALRGCLNDDTGD